MTPLILLFSCNRCQLCVVISCVFTSYISKVNHCNIADDIIQWKNVSLNIISTSSGHCASNIHKMIMILGDYPNSIKVISF